MASEDTCRLPFNPLTTDLFSASQQSKSKLSTELMDLMEDEKRLNALVNAVSKMAASILALRNDEICGKDTPLVKVLYEEREYVPSRKRQDMWSELREKYIFAVIAEQSAARLRTQAQSSDRVSLKEHATSITYSHCEDFERKKAGELSTLRVGGLGLAIFEELKKQIVDWLIACDRAMCHAFEDHGVDESPHGGVPERLNTLVKTAANKIASQLSLWGNLSDEPLHATMELAASKELKLSEKEASDIQQIDVFSLKVFRSIAQSGASTEEQQQTVDRLGHHIAYIVCYPPVELQSHPGMGLSLLKRAFDNGLDLEVRCSLIQEWHACHGAAAAAGAELAIDKLHKWSSSDRTPFAVVIGGEPTAHSMPVLTFAPQSQRWFFVTEGAARQRRTGLNFVGRRVLRLASLVWHMEAHGELQPGVIDARLAEPVAAQSLIEARMVAGLLIQKRNVVNTGSRLLKFMRDVSDAESHMSTSVASTMCALSHFSFREVDSVFHHTSAVLPMLSKEFSGRVRTWMANKQTPMVNCNYNAFAMDALAIALPVFKRQRSRAGVNPLCSPDPVADMLRTLPKVANWSPLKGSLRLYSEDLTNATPETLQMIKNLAQEGRLVQRGREVVGNGRRSRTAFVFNTRDLVSILAVQQHRYRP